MDALPCRLVCIDFQPDAVPEREPAPEASQAARQLLTLGRRLGWTIVHTRRRTRQPLIRTRNTGAATGLNPLMSEPVFFHDTRSLADNHGLAALLHDWRGETLLVAAFDPMALMSLVLACHEPGPRLTVVQDVTPLAELPPAPTAGPFHGKGWKGAFAQVTLADLVRRANRQGVHLFPPPAADRSRVMPA